MDRQRLAVMITALNLVLLVLGLAEVRPIAAQGVTQVLRGARVGTHGRPWTCSGGDQRAPCTTAAHDAPVWSASYPSFRLRSRVGSEARPRDVRPGLRRIPGRNELSPMCPEWT